MDDYIYYIIFLKNTENMMTCRNRTITLILFMETYIIAEPIGEARYRGARSHNAFVCMYISVPINYHHLDRLHNSQAGAGIDILNYSYI